MLDHIDKVFVPLAASSRSDVEIYQMWEIFKAVNAKVKAGGKVVSLLAGEPTLPPPQAAIKAAQDALSSGKPLGYTEALGIPALREGIAQFYQRRHGLEISSSRVAVTVGTSSGLMLAFLAAFSAGDTVAVVEPSYPAYRGTLKAIDLVPYRLTTNASTGYRVTPEMIAALPAQVKGVVIASPANPTGTMLSAEELRAIYDLCQQRGLWLIVDELYHGVTYDRAAETVLSVGDDAIVINGFSKYWGMTGWRIGWLVLPERLVSRIEALHGSLQISAPTLSQLAGIAALNADAELTPRVEAYRRNRDKLLAALPRWGITRFAPPDGAFYLYIDVGDFTDDSVAFCRRMLDETGVVAAPGVDFNTADGHRYIRFSFCMDAAIIDDAIARLDPWFRRLNRQ
ncbi:aminotransferase class I/II-fold pyridoxal phosphate-dependent enzyme [Ferrovibrio terrae]|uniref:Aminotransferase n=1 Tax=Ferrovibrio terrae TaxID=2594003 RepID=A0A516H2Q5_9PROT|nr:aminotransferase class I/II-fold pyridoxal phosphate-dependent enzyme [Ferrovibrio terrae]QDO98054.1 aminotransferase class I/II-fold pyridoxal phosphate-dependent enzyme [Ferrovibrio terrae]